MSEAAYKAQLEAIRRQMFKSTAIDVNTACAYSDWMNNQLADLDREKAQAEKMKNTRLAGRMSLRSRLKNLLSLFYHKTLMSGKGAAQDA